MDARLHAHHHRIRLTICPSLWSLGEFCVRLFFLTVSSKTATIVMNKPLQMRRYNYAQNLCHFYVSTHELSVSHSRTCSNRNSINDSSYMFSNSQKLSPMRLATAAILLTSMVTVAHCDAKASHLSYAPEYVSSSGGSCWLFARWQQRRCNGNVKYLCMRPPSRYMKY